MPQSRPARLALVAGTLAIVAASASTITYAATNGTTDVAACTNSAGTLRLLDSKGKCASGYSKVTIAQEGPQGPAGPQGKAGPGAKTVTIATRGTTAKSASYQVPATTIRAVVTCSAGVAGRASLRLVDPIGVVPFRAVGSTVVDQGEAPVYSTSDDSGTEVPTGVVDTFALLAEKGPDQAVGFEIGAAADRTNAISVQVLVTVGGRSFSVTAYAAQSAARCESTAQVVVSA